MDKGQPLHAEEYPSSLATTAAQAMNSLILKNALQLIENPETWCKGARARNKDGQEVPVMSESAVCFCSRGALYRVVGSEDADIRHLERFFGHRESVINSMLLLKNSGNPLGLHYVGLNELRTHAEMMALWADAIRLAEAEEARGGPMTEREAIEEFFHNL